MQLMIPPGRLDRPVDHERDHVLGPADAEITLVEYGSYACPHCRAANERIAQARDQLGDRVCYAFRHRPLTDNSLSFRAAELVELAQTPEAFWSAHIKLMTRSMQLTEDDLVAVATDLGVNADFALGDSDAVRRARARVEADVASSRASGVRFTPTFYINRRRYDGPWDESSLVDAMLGTLGHRVRTAALDFASWGPSAGILLVLATVAAIVLTNSPIGPAFEALWRQELGVSLGDAAFQMSILHWVNDGLLTVFFLVVGLEVKREMTVGHLASRRSAALPIAAALGGMVVPALLYALVIPAGPWSHGWGVPMATDTAFAIALIAVMGARVPVELRIFLTAAAIVDDIGAIVVVAVFYSGDIHPGYLGRGCGGCRCAGAAEPIESLPALALHPVGRRVVGFRLRGRPPRDAGRRGAGAVHSDAAARRPGCPDDASQHHHRLRGPARGRGAQARPLHPGAARARRDLRQT